MEWRTFDTAPIIEDLIASPIPRCLVYGPDIGIQMGRAWRYSDGDSRADAAGFHGDWLITHWMPLPEPPK